MSNRGDDRSEGTDPPAWWLDRFKAEHTRREDENRRARAAKKPEPFETGVQALGTILAERIGRAKPWHHSAVVNFLNGTRFTREMAEAFSLLYRIPRFEKVVRAETEAQAIALEMFLRELEVPARHHGSENTNRVADVDEVAAVLQQSAEDQIAGVDSKNERANRGRRAGRAPRRS